LKAALSSIRVLDFSQAGAGPSGAMFLNLFKKIGFFSLLISPNFYRKILGFYHPTAAIVLQ
jgi:hypothetical protein